MERNLAMARGRKCPTGCACGRHRSPSVERRRKVGNASRGRPRPDMREKMKGESNPMRRPEVAAKAGRAKHGKSYPRVSESRRAYLQTEAGLLLSRKLSFLRRGHSGYWKIPRRRLLWRKFLWWLHFGRGNKDGS